MKSVTNVLDCLFEPLENQPIRDKRDGRACFGGSDTEPESVTNEISGRAVVTQNNLSLYSRISNPRTRLISFVTDCPKAREARIAAVQDELSGWRDSLRMRQAALDPYEDAFQVAHNRAAAALQAYPMHAGNQVIKSGYDGRLAAGVARNPFRQAVREADRVVKVLTVELKTLIEENAP